MQNFPRLDLELEERVTRRQIDFVRDARIPTRDDEAARVRGLADPFDEARDLIHAVARRVMAAEGTPEVAVDGAEVAGRAFEAARVRFVRPLGPDVHAARAQVSFVGVAGEELEEFFGHPAEGDFLGGDDGEASAQVEARLVAEVRESADARAVAVLGSAFEDGFEQVVILFHIG